MGKKPGGYGKASTLVTFSAAYAHCFSFIKLYLFAEEVTCLVHWFTWLPKPLVGPRGRSIVFIRLLCPKY